MPSLQKEAASRAVIPSKKFVAYEWQSSLGTSRVDMVLAYCRPSEGEPWKDSRPECNPTFRSQQL
jgi:hypothetical protein